MAQKIKEPQIYYWKLHLFERQTKNQYVMFSVSCVSTTCSNTCTTSRRHAGYQATKPGFVGKHDMTPVTQNSCLVVLSPSVTWTSVIQSHDHVFEWTSCLQSSSTKSVQHSRVGQSYSRGSTELPLNLRCSDEPVPESNSPYQPILSDGLSF